MVTNIFIPQIPCEYDQMRVTNMIEIKHNKLRIPTQWWEADQLAISVQGMEGHRRQIHLVAGRRI